LCTVLEGQVRLKTRWLTGDGVKTKVIMKKDAPAPEAPAQLRKTGSSFPLIGILGCRCWRDSDCGQFGPGCSYLITALRFGTPAYGQRTKPFPGILANIGDT
jgi:hypothetical protein